MTTLNRVLLIGNLTRDPESRQLQSGSVVADLGVAVNERHRSAQGEVIERTCFADVVVWGKQAEVCAKYLQKGAPVFIEGRLQLDQWQTSAGEKRSRLRIKADRVQFLPRRRSNGTPTNIPETTNTAQATQGDMNESATDAPPYPF